MSCIEFILFEVKLIRKDKQNIYSSKIIPWIYAI